MNAPTSRIALVTGGSRGLGRSMALHLADHGTDLIVTYRTGSDEAQALVAEITRRGRKSVALPLDVADADGFPAFVEAVRSALRLVWDRDRFDFLVNNAGVGLHAPFAQTTEEQFDQLMKIHLRGPFFLTQRLLPLIADGGRILNVSTGLARFSLPGYAAYATMKGGIEVLTRYLAKELGPRRIAVNAIAPGAIETDFGGGVVRDNPELNRGIAAQTALGRVGLPDDIGGAVAMLLAPESNWITGQRIEFSGGMML
ncbi:short-chain dehydrogenase/reductase SDR [Anaeromyxobacter sp. K]|uniref:SDR family NAD(P)-dependent oxidoreductase n=1 Tax=Anaeromyxobacter sp. (strain K) TaxID=447217 RepID=UPI00015F8802|nr:SDR family oxidoreductase [Anaeromyxobacter sp. K]ACG74572.1 short-chain dehydrogenase/reductase SDR [Anaeromyxobacter sp. K]